jgi:colanic acid/amylovoran biosynthesis glycosyltransferase
LKIAYLLKKFPRLSETFVLTEILAQEALGAEVVVFSRRAPDPEPRHPEVARLRAAVEVFPRHSELDPWTEMFGQHQAALDVEGLSQLGRIVTELKPVLGDRLPRVLPEALHLKRRSQEEGVDHIHVHFATESAIVAMIAHELGGPTYSITAHAKDIYRTTVRADLLNRMIAGSRFMVTVCDANLRYLQERLSDAACSKVRRLYNGLDLANFQFRTEGRDKDHVLAVGRLVEKKGFDVLLTALRLLKLRGRSIRATIVGQGDQEQSLRGQAQVLGLSDAEVTFTGPKDQDGVRALLESATIFSLPCVIGADGNRDALPTVLLEALASGLPCVSTPVTGIPEILDNGEAGLIVPERDAEALALAMSSLLDDADARARFAKRGLARVMELFDAEQSARTLSSWFEDSLHLEPS